MRKFIQLILILSWTPFSIAQNEHSYSEFKASIGKIELVKVLPTLSGQHKKFFRTINYYSLQSIINNVGPKYFNEEKISQPLLVDSISTDIFVDLIYSDSSSHSEMLCYEPRHGILLWSNTGKYLGFVELCFECRGVRTTPGLPRPQLTNDTFVRLELLFKTFGLVDEVEND